MSAYTTSVTFTAICDNCGRPCTWHGTLTINGDTSYRIHCDCGDGSLDSFPAVDKLRTMASAARSDTSYVDSLDTMADHLVTEPRSA